MPARWVELALRIHGVIDDADHDLDDQDRRMFYDQTYRIVIARRHRRPAPELRHPHPQPMPDAVRDPTGDTDDLGT